VSINDYLRFLVDKSGSDLHLKVGGPAQARIDGELSEIHDLPVLKFDDTVRFAEEVLGPALLEKVRAGEEADAAYSVPGLGRFRVAVFRQRGATGLVIRRVLPGSQDFAALGLPPAVRKLSEEHRGLVLVTGPTGSGKTTTTAAMISHINATRRCHIVTIEDPIEILHRDDLAIVDQREVGMDTASFATAMRSVARQDPDVVFIGEMRDLETVSAALQAAQTGHLVVSTLHTTNATETITRIVDLYPPHQQAQARQSLASSLKGIVCQRLLVRQGGGRVAALEVLVMTARIQEFISDPALLASIEEAVAGGAYYGMQTFDQHIMALYSEGLVSLKDALDGATSPHDLRLAIRNAGLEG